MDRVKSNPPIRSESMIETPSPPRRTDPETRRALQLDTLAAILPMDRRDRLAQLLTDDDVATLTHLAREGMGANTLRALASDLAYLETWAWAVLSGPAALRSRFAPRGRSDRARTRA